MNRVDKMPENMEWIWSLLKVFLNRSTGLVENYTTGTSESVHCGRPRKKVWCPCLFHSPECKWIHFVCFVKTLESSKQPRVPLSIPSKKMRNIKKWKAAATCRLKLDSSWILEPNVQYLHVLNSTVTDCPPSTSCKASAIPDSHEPRTGLAAEVQVASRATYPNPSVGDGSATISNSWNIVLLSSFFSLQ